MTTSPSIRIGFIGAGSIARARHLPALVRMTGVDVVVVANRSAESSQAVAREFNIPEVADDWRRILDRRDIDAVFIGTWPYMHKEMSVAVLEAGKHVFCQARMAMDLAEARAMVEAARAHPQLVNMICPPPTRMPFEPYIRQVLIGDVLGQIVAVELVSASGANLDAGKVHWRERSEFSGKQVLAMGIYAETLNAWVGPYQTLTAHTSTPVRQKQDESGRTVDIAIPQVAMISGQLRNGALIVERHLGLAADKTSRGDRLTIWGLRGTLRYRFGQSIELAEAGAELQPVNVPENLQRPWQVEQDFIEAVRLAQQGQVWKVSPDFEEGLEYMKKVEAVHLSASLGRAVDLEKL